MTDKRISQLTNLTGANLADDDEFVVVDTSESETKAITRAELELGLERLGYNGTAKLSTTATGIDVTGTLTADGLTVDGDAKLSNTDGTTLRLEGSGASVGQLLGRIKAETSITLNSDNPASIKFVSAGTNSGHHGGAIEFHTANKNATGELLRLDVKENGDISFYEDTGTTPTFFWDASAEALGIGVAAPVRPLHVQAANNGGSVSTAIFENNASLAGSQSEIILVSGGNTARGASISSYNESASGQPASMLFSTSAAYATPTERLRITSTGSVGIGTSSPAFSSGSGLEIERTDSNSTLRLQRAGTSPSSMEIRSGANTGEIFVTSNSPLLFATNGEERARIDASGHLIVPAGITLGTAVGVHNAANTLDDYEEGTWSPSFTNLTVGNGTVYGTYTKVGRLVTAVFGFICGSTTSVGNLGDITGLPFASANDFTGFIKVHGVVFDVGSRWFEAVAALGYGVTDVLVPSIPNYNSGITATSPMTWTTNDTLKFTVTYYTT